MSSSTPSRRRTGSIVAGLSLAVLAIAACAPSTATNSTGSGTDEAAYAEPVIDSDFDLAALTAAAQKEGSVTVYDSTGDIKKVADAFQKKYGIKTNGTKSDVGDTLEKMTREAQAKNVTIDLTLYEDGPSLVGQLLPQKTVYSWIPADLADQIDEAGRNPLMVLSKANVWIYNPKVFPNGCPVDNLWDLTSPDWKGKVTMQDPLGKPNIVEWFNQMGSSYDDALRTAYKAETGKDLSTTESSAAKEWVKQLAKNQPVLTTSDDDVSAAVASPNQTEPRIGLVSIAKFRDIEGKKYQMKVCDTLKPYVGYQYPKYGAIATGTKHPNAAKLFLRFVLTEEGISPEMGSGGISSSKAVAPSKNNPPGLTDWPNQLMTFDSSKLLTDYRDAQSMQDFWRLNHH